MTLFADVIWTPMYSEVPINIDSDYTVTIKQPQGGGTPGFITKWAVDWGTKDSSSVEGTSIQWGVRIFGGSEGTTKIVGQTITDTILDPGDHYFSETNRAIYIEATDHNGDTPVTYNWTVQEGDSGLTWSADGKSWAYTMPNTVTMDGKTVNLGDANWEYYMGYTSTINNEGTATNPVSYENRIQTQNGDNANAYITAGSSTANAGIRKWGWYSNGKDADFSNDTFDWVIEATIPAKQAGAKKTFGWSIWDVWEVLGGKPTQPGGSSPTYESAMVDGTPWMQISYNGSPFERVPEYTENIDVSKHNICWYSWDKADKKAGHGIEVFCKCDCTKDTCQQWYGDKCRGNGSPDRKYCNCWNVDRNVVIQFGFSSAAGNLPVEQGGIGAQLQNTASLNSKFISASGVPKDMFIGRADARVDIPGVFTKKQTKEAAEANKYIAEYTITVNEVKTDLSMDQDGITITDTMSKTLNFLDSSLKIMKEDNENQQTQLTKGTDYTVDYAYGNGVSDNVLTITLKPGALGPCKYTLVYNASVGYVGGDNETDKAYVNSATVQFSDASYTKTTDMKPIPSAMMTAERYWMRMRKLREVDGNPLSGANFGLFSGDGTKMEDCTTGSDGLVMFQTGNGLVLYEHRVYYVQEREAPQGYKLDATKHYFWFCNKGGVCADKCAHAERFQQTYSGATPIYSGRDATTIDLTITNQMLVRLPNTGGPGATLYVVGGLLILCAGVLLLYRRQQQRKANFTSF